VDHGTRSRRRIRHHPNRSCWRLGRREHGDGAHPYGEAADLEGLPPALVIVDENDVLRDQGEAYADKLRDAGVPTTSVRFNGTIHDFMRLNALRDSESTRAAISLATAALRRAFGTE
jgi:acetyl esterase/lipase